MTTTRTITLTGRPPVTITTADWPMVASASDREFDGEYDFQANETSKWFVGARRHSDGRSIVYATYSYDSNWRGRRDHAAKRGVLLGAKDDICEAIQDVCDDIAGAECQGNDCDRWPTLAAECIADMPTETLV